jgi:hypothetical protein
MLIDWPHLDLKAWPAWDTAVAYCDGIASGIWSFCASKDGDWAGKTQLQAKIKTLECRFDGQHVCGSDAQKNEAEMLKDVEMRGSSIVVHAKMGQCSSGAGKTILQKAFGSYLPASK